jgi:hypothetical protein
MKFTPGQKVKTPKGSGVVKYQRMAPPTYTDAQSVSVVLDSCYEESNNPNYTGTIFPAEQVTPIK